MITLVMVDAKARDVVGWGWAGWVGASEQVGCWCCDTTAANIVFLLFRWTILRGTCVAGAYTITSCSTAALCMNCTHCHLAGSR